MAAPDLLQKLLTAPGPPGHESDPARVWREAAEGFADEVTTDRLGTTVARVNGTRRPPADGRSWGTSTRSPCS